MNFIKENLYFEHKNFVEVFNERIINFHTKNLYFEHKNFVEVFNERIINFHTKNLQKNLSLNIIRVYHCFNETVYNETFKHLNIFHVRRY